MFINITPKKLKQRAIIATFEHHGVAYEEHFQSVKRFKNYVQRTPDRFINAVNLVSMETIHPHTLGPYLN